MYGNGPRLSVSTQAGPFNPATPARRPQGARRRGIAPGLFVANPDKSDDEGSSPRSPTRGSPITTSSSSSGRAGGPVLPAGAASQCIARGGLATVPAPQSSQIPSPASFHSPHGYEPTPPPTASPVRLQPSPQPERHARRAFTTPVHDNFARPTHEPRTASGSSVLHGHPPSSPSRALPLLPSPPLRSAQPSMVPSSAPPQNAPLVPPPLYPTPSSIRSHPDYLQRRRDEHTASPEKAMSPATHTSEGRVTVMGINSPEASYRIRSGSVQNMVRLQVTTDNEQFTLVDITGMQTAEAIRESVFSKLRFRDDDHPTLAVYRTDIGESPDPFPLSNDGLLHLCATVGDSKATLKLLVVQNRVPQSSSATVVPPNSATVYRSNSHRRARMPPITTDLSRQSPSARTPSHSSNRGSLSSASESFERGPVSNSDWSEIGHEEARDSGSSVQAQARQPTRQLTQRTLRSSAGRSRTPTSDPSVSTGSSSPVLPTPPAPAGPPMLAELNITSSPISRRSIDSDIASSPSIVFSAAQRKGTTTPFASPVAQTIAQAGPSQQRKDSGLGLEIEGMDPETLALIEQFQREEEQALEAEQRRRRQLEADEEFARKEQQSERDVWQRMQQVQSEQRLQQQQQIEQDEIRAREVAAEEHRLEEHRLRQEVARTAWEAEQQETWEEERRDVADQQTGGRSARYSQDRRQRSGQAPPYPGQNTQNPLDARRLPSLDSRDTWPSVPAQRPLNLHLEASRQHQYPTSNPVFDQPIYQSPPAQYQAEVPSPGGFAQQSVRQSSGQLPQAMTQRIEARSRQIGRLPRLPADTLPVRREKLRAGLASSAFRNPEDTLRAPSVQNIRSMDSLRPLQPDVPVSRPPYQGIPSHTANTPTRISGPGERSYVSAGLNRNPSIDRAQDGRYPEPSHSATSRGPPLQIPSPAQNTNFMPFLSPHVRPSGSNTSYRASSSLDARRASDSQAPPSPQVQAFHQVQPAASSPESATLFRQPLTPSEVSAARTIAYENYTPTTPVSWRPRSESASAVYRSSSPLPSESRRASDGNLDDRSDTQLPYAHPNLSPEQQSWLSLPRSNRGDTSDTASVAGTVSSWYSESTVGARTVSVDGEEGDSNDTAKAGDHTSQLRAMLEGGEGSAGSPKSLEAEDEEEATLFLTGPLTPNLGHRPLIIHPSPSRPNLKVDTNPAIPARAGVTTPSDSATESESESRITRAKSFARPRDQPEKWNIRPEPEQLYEHLDNFFPKIDLDKPIVEGGPSTPSTPSVESPAPLESVPPPSIHPSRQPLTPTMSPRSPDQNRPLPPPLHPSRAVGLSDRRKSIRVVVDHKRRTIQRESRNMDVNRDVYAAKQDAKKLDRRKSSSMWGYRIQEVTPSKIVEGQVPTTIPESPFTDGKPATLTWVKGELIGKGSYGRVYLGLNVTTGDMMAVKQVELPVTEQARNDRRQVGMIEALQSEIALLKDMYHPNIVTYLGWETSPEYLSIFLEYVPGGTIASIYNTPNQGRFGAQLVKFFTAQILEGLAYLHAKHIWHRDLKGDNILVDAAGVCKISDFGISKQTSDAYDSFGQATNMKGSVFWMAPEVIHSANERTYSGKVDIWSLGCVVLEMWTGKRPWGDMEQVAAMFELFNKRSRPQLPPDVHISDVALDFMNNRCLAKNPRDRPMARDLLQHQFITDVDPSWTFAGSRIGKAVAKKAPKSIKAMAS